MLSVIHPNSQRGLLTVGHYHLHDNALATQSFPGLQGYKFMSGSHKPGDEDERLAKHMNKSLKSLESVCRLLHRPSNKPKTPSEQSRPDNTPEVVTGGGSFSLEFPLSDQQNGPETREIFTRLQLQWRNGTTSTQYFRAHIPSIKPALLNDPFKSIHINTGICLFSKPALSLDPGKDSLGSDCEKITIPRIPERDEHLTLYELEIITRLSLAIADTAALIGDACRDHCTLININLDIPDFQYFWTACELLERKLVDVRYVYKWVEAISERRSRLFNIMSSMIHMSLIERQLSYVKICLTSGTEAAVELTMNRLPAGPMPTLDELLDELQQGHSDAEQWKNFLAHLDPRHQPSTISELGRLMYVFKVVKPALAHGPPQLLNGSPQGHGKNLIIMVDNSTEWRIFDRARTFLKRYTKNTNSGTGETLMVGLFPLEKIFVAGARRSDLYLEDPGMNKWTETEPSRVGPLDVIDTVYGSVISERLQTLCHREGFKAAMRESPREYKLSVLSIHKVLMALYSQITTRIRAWLKAQVLDGAFAGADAEEAQFYQYLKKNNRIQAEFHVTLIHVNDRTTHPEIWEKYKADYIQTLAREGSGESTPNLGAGEVLPDHLVWDQRIMALAVKANGKDGPLPCANVNAHVTIGTADESIKAFESNDLLKRWREGDQSKGAIHSRVFPMGYTFEGSIQANFAG